MISKSIRVPGSYTEIDTSAANNSLPSTRQEMVIVAQRLSTGAVDAHVPKRIFSPAEAAINWGSGSIMHRMVMAAFRKYKYLVLTGCAVDDASAGAAAAEEITFSGAATASGTITIYIGNNPVTISVANEDDDESVAAAFAAEIGKYPDLPVTPSSALAVLTLTSKNKGTCGNLIGKYNGSTEKYESVLVSTVPGISATTTGFTGGAEDPDLSDAYAALSGHKYHLYVLPYNTLEQAQDLDEHLENISDEINQKGARGYMFCSAAVADAITVSGVNAERVNLGCIRGSRRPSFENAAAFAAIQASQEIPWKGINNEELTGCDAPDIEDRLTYTEINNLLWNGVTPFTVGSGERVRCVRSITTYTENAAGTPDHVWLDSFKVATADYVRDAIVESHLRNFANSVLRDNHVDGEPDDIVTPSDVVSNNIAVCKRIEIAGGLNNVNAFIDQFTAERDSGVPGRVNSAIPIDIVDAAHIFANTIKIVLAVKGV